MMPGVDIRRAQEQKMRFSYLPDSKEEGVKDHTPASRSVEQCPRYRVLHELDRSSLMHGGSVGSMRIGHEKGRSLRDP